MLRFNTFRASRYLRSKFVEGKYLLASEASDLELEILDLLRKNVQNYLGDIAIEDAWKVERLSATQILIKPGEAWFKGLPFLMRSGKDQLVSGAILALGTVPVGVTSADDSTGLGKILTFNNAAVTPTNLYRIVVTAKEELLTEVDDPFLQNANLTESTSQKIRVVFQINIVPDSLQSETSVPYRDESSAAGSPTNFPNVGGSASPNFVNQATITPTAAGNGELLALNLITGSETIDGRDVEIILRNNPALGGGNPIPNSPTLQQAFSNGTLIDSNGNIFHINAIFNDVVSTQVVLRLDKEPDQTNPEIINTRPFTIKKRDVFVTDDVNGSPQGKLHWPIATLDWNSTNGIIHDSKIVDSRVSVTKEDAYQKIINQKLDLVLADGGVLSWDLATAMLSWSSAFNLINPHGVAQSIPTGSIPLVNGGSVVYEMNLSGGGSIARGTQAINVTVASSTSSLSAVNLSDVRKGNIVVDNGGVVAEITNIDDVNNTITTSPALSNTGAALIYKDSYGPGKAPISLTSFVLAVRSGSRIFVGDGLELEDGESSELGSVPQQLLDFIGSTGETDDSPNYAFIPSGAAPHPFSQGDDLVTAIGATVGNVNDILATLDNPSYEESVVLVSPITSGSIVTIPVNTRLGGSPQQFYTVGKGALEIFYNGQFIVKDAVNGWSEVGLSGDPSDQIQINQNLPVGDTVTYRIGTTGGPGSGGGGGGGSPGGTSGDIQYNNASSFDGSGNFKIDVADGSINLNGLRQSILSSTLTVLDNTASPTSLFTFVAATYHSFIIEYSITRNGNSRIGQLMINHDGTNLGYNDMVVNSLASLGVTLSADLSGPNVRILYTSTNTGFNASLKYSVRRWS